MHWHEPSPPSELAYCEEVAMAKGWAQKVQELYVAGRLSAHAGLRDLRMDGQPLLRGEDGAPIWPDGVLGSISHTSGVGMAVVSTASGVLALGIDVEKGDRILKSNLVDKVCCESEGDWVLKQDSDFRLLRLLSAKEAVFKAVCGLSKIRLGFKEAILKSRDDGFHVEIRHPRVSKEWPEVKFVLRQGLWRDYLVSGLCIEN